MAREPLFVVGSDPVLTRFRRLLLPALLGAVLGLVGGLVVHLQAPPTWTAQVSVELSALRDHTDLNPTGAPGRLVSMDTDAQLARSDAVVLAVAVQQQRLPHVVQRSIGIGARPLSRVMLISYTARSPEAAEEGAALLAQRFLEERDRLYLDPQRAYLANVVQSTQAIDPEFDLVQAAGAASAREGIRRRAFVQDLSMPQSGRVVAENGFTAVADRGDIEVPLTSGAALGALLAVAVVLMIDVTRGTSTGAVVPTAGRSTPRRTRSRSVRPALAGGVALVVICSAVSVTAASVLVPTTYTGHARVYLPPERGNAFASRGSTNAERVDLGTEAELSRSDEVLASVVAHPAVDLTVPELRSRTRSTVTGRGQVVEVTVRSGDREQAERLASSVAESLVSAREARAETWNGQQEQRVDEAITVVETDLRAALAPGGSREAINALNRRLATLRADAQAVVANPVDGGEVTASWVQRREGDRYETLAVAAAGPVIGAGLGLLVWRGLGSTPRPPRRRDRADVEGVRALGLTGST